MQPTSAVADLVYLLETLVEVELAAEHEVLPLFQRLWALRGRHDAAAFAQMQGIQAGSRERFVARLET